MPITVFIADDHPVMCDGLTHLLQSQEDIRVVGVAANGLDAVRQVCRLYPNVLVADIAMPEMNGIEATRQIRQRSPATQVVILSMHSTPDHIFHALQAGALGYILKENAGRTIIDAVRAVHRGKRYLCERAADVLAEHAARRSGPNPLDDLSTREREILQLVAEGCTSAEIAGKLSLSPKTVDSYRSRLMEKLGIHDVAGLVKFSILHGLTTLE
jgi:DNA-binding NarL/FixJ family response regulator